MSNEAKEFLDQQCKGNKDLQILSQRRFVAAEGDNEFYTPHAGV